MKQKKNMKTETVWNHTSLLSHDILPLQLRS